MAIQQIGECNGAVLTMEINNQQKIIAATLDCTNALGPVRFLYPEDGGRINQVFPPGTVTTRTFSGNAQLSRFTALVAKPNGEQVLMWTSPTWKLESA